MKTHNLDPLSLPYLAQFAAETANPVVALIAQIEAVRSELDRAPDWKRGTEWWTDREAELRMSESQLARRAPGHPSLPANVMHISPTGSAHVEPSRGRIVLLPSNLRDPFGCQDTATESQEPTI